MRLGILGGGQLARMMALEAHWLGIETDVYDPKHDCCASLVANHHRAEYSDREALMQFAKGCSVVTCDFENVPGESIAMVEKTSTPFHPRGIQYFQNRYIEKGYLFQNGLPVTEFQPAYGYDSLLRVAEKIKPPFFIKKQMYGYDGKGQALVSNEGAIRRSWERLFPETPGASKAVDGQNRREEVIIEKFVRYDREISIIAVRGRDGRFVHYPLAVNCHHNGILKCTVVVSQPVGLTMRAAGYAHKLMKKLDYLGVMVIELFLRGDDLIINEIAPRPHNSGHWSVDGAACSQFENHVRAVMGMPLGSASAHHPCCAMLNLIGDDVGDGDRHDEMINKLGFMLPSYAKIHNYCKHHVAGRKLGHIFIYTSRENLLLQRIEEICNLVTGATDLYDMSFELPASLTLEG